MRTLYPPPPRKNKFFPTYNFPIFISQAFFSPFTFFTLVTSVFPLYFIFLLFLIFPLCSCPFPIFLPGCFFLISYNPAKKDHCGFLKDSATKRSDKTNQKTKHITTQGIKRQKASWDRFRLTDRQCNGYLYGRKFYPFAQATVYDIVEPWPIFCAFTHFPGSRTEWTTLRYCHSCLVQWCGFGSIWLCWIRIRIKLVWIHNSGILHQTVTTEYQYHIVKEHLNWACTVQDEAGSWCGQGGRG